MPTAKVSTFKGLRAFGGVRGDRSSVRSAPSYVEQLVFSAAGSKILTPPVSTAGGDKAGIVILTAAKANAYAKFRTASTAAGFPAGTTADGSGFEAIPTGTEKAYMLERFIIGSSAIYAGDIQMDGAGTLTAAFYQQNSR